MKKQQQNWLSIMVFLGPVKPTTELDSYDPNAEILHSKTHVLRWLDTVFLIPPKSEHKLSRHKQRFGKIAATVILDKDENLL